MTAQRHEPTRRIPSRWIRFSSPDGTEGFGTVEGDEIAVHTGSLFGAAARTDGTMSVADVTVLAPCRPTKVVALWNNLRAAAGKNGWAEPAQPLYFVKPPSSVVGHRATVRKPSSYDGRILYEGELGVVIGQQCRDVMPSDVDEVVFGYTCVNDVTALDVITEDAAFPQWCRAKGFDTFCPIGPVIATGIEPDGLVVRTLVGGKVRQEYPVSDMFFGPRELVSRVSCDMTLEPGDVISCGTGLGAMPMRPGVEIEVQIDGIGALCNSLRE